MADIDVISALKEGLKYTKERGGRIIISELHKLQMYRCEFKNNGNAVCLWCSYLNMQHIKQSVGNASPIIPLH